MKKWHFFWAICFPLPIFADALPSNPPEQAKVCMACHGPTGESVNPIWPNLAGQHPKYLIKQLKDYKLGSARQDPSMAPMVANLSEEDMAILVDFYAKQPASYGTTPKKYVTLGQQIYRGGDFKKGITACIACHGPQGKGNAQAGFPWVAGQHALYTIDQLKEYKNKTRTNDLNEIMRDIASHMSDEDMEAVAYYIQGLH